MNIFASIVAFLVLCMACISTAAQCRGDADCKFNGKCIRGECTCMENCMTSGVMLLCGEDGYYYINYCFITMRSCELQKEVKVHSIGQSSHCAARHSPFTALLPQIRINGYAVCGMENNHCFNYGVCIRRNHQRVCLCPRGFRGNRCQYRDAPLSNAEFAVHRSAMTGHNTTPHRDTSLALVLNSLSRYATS